jgi:hypothetical protein
MPKDLTQHPASTYLPGDVLVAVDADAELRGLSRAAWLREVAIAAVVRRTTKASGVPERVEDAGAIEETAAVLRSGVS